MWPSLLPPTCLWSRMCILPPQVRHYSHKVLFLQKRSDPCAVEQESQAIGSVIPRLPWASLHFEITEALGKEKVKRSHRNKMQSYASPAATSVPPACETMGCPSVSWNKFKLPHTNKCCSYHVCALLHAWGVSRCLQDSLRAEGAQRNCCAFLHSQQV